ncbi:MAG: A24 family peptidase [Eubacteriales bacterium]|nr:A24 family peptidase [Eubacteriales bacterium]
MIGTATGADIIMPPRILPPTIHPMNPDIAMMMLPYLAVALVGALLGRIVAAVIKKKFGGELNPLNIILPCVISVLIALRFGFGTELIQGSILSLLLLFAANSDGHTREVSDTVPLMIAITALIGAELSDIPMMLLSAVLITLPQLAVAIWNPGTYGGADIKLMAACTFLLGFGKGLFAIIVGLLLAVICTLIYRKAKKQDTKASFALIPYLAIGCMVAFFI